MKHLLAVCILLLGPLAGFVSSADAPSGPAEDVPELRPLDHWAGKWDTRMSIKPNAAQPNGASSKGVASAEWIHDGRFLRETWSSEAGERLPRMSGTIIMTFDPRKRVYRSWSFFSTGFVSVGEGAWDEKSRTMSWTSRDGNNGASTTTKAIFADDDTQEWSIATKDAQGKVLTDISGKNTRRK